MTAKRQIAEMGARGARWVWHRLPPRLLASGLGVATGRWIHRRVVRHQERKQSYYTRFWRNAPLMDKIRDLVLRDRGDRPLDVISFGCSSGAEMYTLLYVLRSSPHCPAIRGLGVDISMEIVEAARRAIYGRDAEELSWLSQEQVGELFDPCGVGLRVKPWITAGTRWIQADASSPTLAGITGCADVVLANNFLGPMKDEEAEACIKNIVPSVRPGGLFVCDGLELNFKMRVTRELGLVPVAGDVEQIFQGDQSKARWPWTRWGHEPINKRRLDWEERYAIVFRRPATAS